MNKPIYFLLLLAFINITVNLQAQKTNAAVAYMDRLSAPIDSVQQNCWDYLSAAIYSTKPQEVAYLQNRWISSLHSAISSVSSLPAFEGDSRYRDSVASYLHYFDNIINTELPLLSQLKADADKSYESAEKYYDEINSLNTIFQGSAEKLRTHQREFARQNGITLYEGSSVNTAEKIKTAIQLNRHYFTTYLMFLKPSKEEENMLAAFDKSDLATAEQNRLNIEKYANESLAKLNTLPPFNKDASLINATKTLVNFYLAEAKNKIPLLIDFLEKNKNFEKIKADFDALMPRTQQQVDTYNKAVQDLNASAILYNSTITELNEQRHQVVDSWNKASKDFLAKYKSPN